MAKEITGKNSSEDNTEKGSDTVYYVAKVEASGEGNVLLLEIPRETGEALARLDAELKRLDAEKEKSEAVLREAQMSNFEGLDGMPEAYLRKMAEAWVAAFEMGRKRGAILQDPRTAAVISERRVTDHTGRYREGDLVDREDIEAVADLPHAPQGNGAARRLLPSAVSAA
jgi:hypothetical protein